MGVYSYEKVKSLPIENQYRVLGNCLQKATKPPKKRSAFLASLLGFGDSAGHTSLWGCLQVRGFRASGSGSWV